MNSVRVGSVHGRFQPFHNDHLEYVVAAKRLCDFLWIGITKYDITPADASPLGAKRERPENNPLSYFERINMIAATLKDDGVSPESFAFVPFPIETPTRLPLFLPISIPCYTTICEEWNKQKITVLQACGYDVRVLWERPDKKITGGAIRQDIMAGGSDWEKLVPKATVKAVRQLNLMERLRDLSKGKSFSSDRI
jgi:nicotinamide-nucleotide adenylyltransferase